MGIFSWILFGALAGWVASLITGRNARMGCLLNILVGVAGALVGGFLMGLISGSKFTMDWNWSSFLVAIIGAVLFLAVTGIANKRHG
ncbi:MAG: GlsB/YeaQ/YmgE family stress response membrane protein [Chloroflexi bacterium]|nr:GlsB/YeaQ/YmgE family stress response membrane protein [Chloroflexota bacterium]